ncbi:MAG: hypothetical protein FD123_2369 [Bacteroidetes bacterium]|nr:MAG: hypothetical protein FD123_2369 [Bacteroidota bacterium]
MNSLRTFLTGTKQVLRKLPGKTWRWYRARWKSVTLVCITLFFGLIYFSHRWVMNKAEGKIFSNADSIPARATGLLLGTNKKLENDSANPYFSYRIEAAAALFHAGKIRHIIVSGDNHTKGYDEATDMRDALVVLGVPDSCITMGFAGFRTLDSVVRCRKVFGQNSVTIISQQFHNERALFIAAYYRMDALAFNAKDVGRNFGWRTQVREYFARVAAVFDLYVFHTAPKFLGEKINVPV